jgi:Flp pilus assembly protein TadB
MTNKTVRPIMTVEARDVLDMAHEEIKGKTRSESIVWLWIMHANLKHQRELSQLSSEIRQDLASDDLEKAKKEARQWKLIAWLMTAACVALIATMMITAS